MSVPGISDARIVRLHRALDETRRFLVDHVDRNITELQNALTRAAAHQSPLHDELAEVAFRELASAEPGALVRASTVMVVASEYFGVTIEELRGARGVNAVAHARQVAMYLCRELTELSLPQIGRAFDRDHTTVMHAVRKVHGQMNQERTAEQVGDLTELVKRRAAVDALRAARKTTGRRAG
ncbi:MAG: helix-turn-helix domain-containing protein [Pseudonocardiaceae bacterium]